MSIRKVDSGHLSDITVDVATMSGSAALLVTVAFQKPSAMLDDRGLTLLNAPFPAYDLAFWRTSLQLFDQLIDGSLLNEIDNHEELLRFWFRL